MHLLENVRCKDLDGFLMFGRDRASPLGTASERSGQPVNPLVYVAYLLLIARCHLFDKISTTKWQRVHMVGLTSAQVAKKSRPLAALLSGGNASDDCTIASRTRRSVSLAIVVEVSAYVAGGSGVTTIQASLANSRTAPL